MPLQFSTASQESVANGIKTLVYAGSGVGKTVLNATLPYPVLISAESGSLSLREANLRRIFGNDPSITYNMPIITVRSVDDLRDAHLWCLQSHEARQFQSVGMDSISEIGEVVLNNAKRLVKDPRQAYQELIEKMETLVRAFRDLPGKNVLISAKMEQSKDGLTGAMKYGPSMPGAKVGPGLPYFFDEVFRLGVGRDQQGKDYRFLQTQPDLQFEAKDRSGALSAVEAPHLGYVFHKIFNT
jgi:AAA domain-containing protein